MTDNDRRSGDRQPAGPMSEDPVFEITDPDEPCDCGCGMAEGV